MMTKERFKELMDGFPHCAQRGAQRHGGKSKRAIPDEPLAIVMAMAATRDQKRYIRAYKCDIPSPVLGKHWHLSSQRRR